MASFGWQPKKIQIIYSTVKAYKLQESLGVMDYLAKLSNSGINVRMLTPKDSSIEESLQNLKNTSSIGINYLETETGIKNKYLIIDRKNSLVIELKDKDDDIDNYYHYLRQKEDENFTPTYHHKHQQILGTSIYSNSKSTVLSYFSIFETLWRQTELYENIRITNNDLQSTTEELKESLQILANVNQELITTNEQLKQADILKTEFINIAAHELRTPELEEYINRKHWELID